MGLASPLRANWYGPQLIRRLDPPTILNEIIGNKPIDQLDNGTPCYSGRDEIRSIPKCSNGIPNRHAVSAEVHENQIVFGIADSHGIPWQLPDFLKGHG